MPSLKKLACKECKKTLVHADLIEGEISIDCPRCGERNIFKSEKQGNVYKRISEKVGYPVVTPLH